MDAMTVTMQGLVLPDGSLKVQGRVGLEPGPVRITVEAMRESIVRSSLADLLAQFAREQAARPMPARTRDEIDSELESMRNEAEEEMQAVEQLQEKARQGQGP